MKATKNKLSAWWPVYLFLSIFTVVLLLFVSGGQAKILAWYVVLCLPVLGLFYLVGGVIRLAWIHRITLPILVSIVIGITTLVPITWLPMLNIWPLAFPISMENTEPKLFIRVPTNQTMLVSNGGNDPKRNVHAFLPPQRWAYDLLVAPVPNDGKELTDYGCYGVPVIAPISGDVILVVNDVPDSVPGEVDVTVNAYGNHIVIKPEQGGFLFVAHLQPGSIPFEEGSKVAEGDTIGQCGNSGNTTEPHVHVHYQAQDPGSAVLLAQGLPLFFRDHEGPAIPNGGRIVDGDKVGYIGDEIRHLPAR